MALLERRGGRSEKGGGELGLRAEERLEVLAEGSGQGGAAANPSIFSWGWFGADPPGAVGREGSLQLRGGAAAAGATSLLPFAEFSPMQVSEGPTTRILTASVQDGESKLQGESVPYCHLLPLLKPPNPPALRCRPSDPIIVLPMATPHPRSSQGFQALLV